MSHEDLTDQELVRIQLFRERVDDLANKGLVNAGATKMTVHLAGHSTKPLEGVDEDHLTSFFATLRQFTLDRDPVHFYSIHKILFRTCPRPELSAWLVYARSSWKQILATSPLGISIDGRSPTVEELLSLFLYSGMVHSDPDKAQEVRELPPPFQGIFKMMLMSSLGCLCHALVVTDKVLWHWFDDPAAEVPPFGDEEVVGDTDPAS